jgi:hypothetical protein
MWHHKHYLQLGWTGTASRCAAKMARSGAILGHRQTLGVQPFKSTLDLRAVSKERYQDCRIALKVQR